MDLILRAVFLDLLFCQPIRGHRPHQGKAVLQKMKCRPVSDVKQNLDLVTGSVESAGRTSNVSWASENELQFATFFLKMPAAN